MASTSLDLSLEFSILLVTYQRFEQLNDAVESVLQQTFGGFECLLFNDYPPDNEKIGQLIRDLDDKRFIFFPSSSSKGANYWRNLGIEKARGKYIAFLDDDDLWLPEKLMKHRKAHENENAFLVFSDYYKSWYKSSRKPLLKQNGIVQENLAQAIGRGDFSISTTSSVSILNQIHWKVFDESLASFQDWDAWLNLSLQKSNAIFFRIKEPLLYFVQHDKVRTSKNLERRLKALKQVLVKYQSQNQNLEGFYNKERVNLFVLEHPGELLLSKLFHSGIFILKNPSLWKYSYTYKRIGRFLFKEHLI